VRLWEGHHATCSQFALSVSGLFLTINVLYWLFLRKNRTILFMLHFYAQWLGQGGKKDEDHYTHLLSYRIFNVALLRWSCYHAP